MSHRSVTEALSRFIHRARARHSLVALVVLAVFGLASTASALTIGPIKINITPKPSPVSPTITALQPTIDAAPTTVPALLESTVAAAQATITAAPATLTGIVEALPTAITNYAPIAQSYAENTAAGLQTTATSIVDDISAIDPAAIDPADPTTVLGALPGLPSGARRRRCRRCRRSRDSPLAELPGSPSVPLPEAPVTGDADVDGIVKNAARQAKPTSPRDRAGLGDRRSTGARRRHPSTLPQLDPDHDQRQAERARLAGPRPGALALSAKICAADLQGARRGDEPRRRRPQPRHGASSAWPGRSSTSSTRTPTRS